MDESNCKLYYFKRNEQSTDNFGMVLVEAECLVLLSLNQ